MKKYVLFRPQLYMSISALTRLSHAGQRFSEKKFCEGLQLYSPIIKYRCRHSYTIIFYHYLAVYLVRIWTYKNSDEKRILYCGEAKA